MGTVLKTRKALKPKYTHGDVPCNGCVLCCKRDAVRLLPEDDPKQYHTEPHYYFKNQLMLAHKPNLDCIYLGDAGCTIHDRKPKMCRLMDCRSLSLNITYTQARKADPRILRLWHKGRQLLKTK